MKDFDFEFKPTDSFDGLFSVDPSNPFEDKIEYIPPEFKRIHIVDKKATEMDNYGIYDYFMECENTPKKLMGGIYNDKIVINTCAGDKGDHYGLGYYIEENYGRFSCSLGSYGEELNVYSNDYISEDQLYLLEGCFKELRDYYLETGHNKSIGFIGGGLSERLSSFKDCTKIDDILLGLSTYREEVFSDRWNSNPNLWI